MGAYSWFLAATIPVATAPFTSRNSGSSSYRICLKLLLAGRHNRLSSHCCAFASAKLEHAKSVGGSTPRDLTPASGRQNHTTSRYTKAPAWNAPALLCPPIGRLPHIA